MKKSTSLFLLIWLFPLAGYAQQKIPDFGKIDPADLALKSCPFEPGASAMKLFDVQEIEFEFMTYGGRLKTERRVRIKIFDEKGYEHASIRIPYFSKRGAGKIKNLRGVVYNLDASGKIVTRKLDEDDFFREKAIENLGIVNFTFPNLKPGSVIEYSYTKVEKNVRQMDPWIVQDEIPVAYSSNIIITPTMSSVKEKAFGMDTVKRVVDLLGSYNNRRKTTYFRENIPSFRPEPYMASQKDNLQKVVFLLIPQNHYMIDVMTSPRAMWKLAGAYLMADESFGKQIKKTIADTEPIIDSAKKMSSTEEKISYLYATVKNRMPDKAEQTFHAGDISEAWKNRSGNTAEINLILLNFLEKAGVKAYPLLVSTRDNGIVNKEFPSLGQLNGVDVLAMDSAKYFLLDASLRYQSYQSPPLNILNREAFLLSPDSMQWVTVTDNRPLLKQNITVFADMKEDGTIEGTATTQYFDYAKSYRLDSTLDAEESKKERFFDRKTQGLKILSQKYDFADQDREPLFEVTEFNYEPQKTDDFIFINPQFLSAKKENPFTREQRNTVIDFGCNQEIVLSLQLNIPPGFEADHLPRNILVRAPDSSFSYKRTCLASGTQLSFTQIIEIRRAQFDKEEYPAIHDFFKRMYALMAEEIVIKKKEK